MYIYKHIEFYLLLVIMLDVKNKFHELYMKVFPKWKESNLTDDLISAIKGCIPPDLLEYVRWTIHSVLDLKRIDEIIFELHENKYVEISDAEKLWVKWKILKIRIPGSSKDIDFDVFISNDTFSTEEFESNEEYKEHSYSRNDVYNLLRLINEWLNENWLISDNLKLVHYDFFNWNECKMAPYFLSKISCQEWKPLIDGDYFLYCKDEGKEWYSDAFICTKSGNSGDKIRWHIHIEDWHLFLKV